MYNGSCVGRTGWWLVQPDRFCRLRLVCNLRRFAARIYTVNLEALVPFFPHLRPEPDHPVPSAFFGLIQRYVGKLDGLIYRIRILWKISDPDTHCLLDDLSIGYLKMVPLNRQANFLCHIVRRDIVFHFQENNEEFLTAIPHQKIAFPDLISDNGNEFF